MGEHHNRYTTAFIDMGEHHIKLCRQSNYSTNVLIHKGFKKI
jgi:hypothetical protein